MMEDSGVATVPAVAVVWDAVEDTYVRPERG